MGYETCFQGTLTIEPPLEPTHLEYLQAFTKTRRMMRNATIADTLPDPKRKAVCPPIGEQGEFFVGNEANYGQDLDASVEDHNLPPHSQPSLWCSFMFEADSIELEDGKNYDYIEWLEYLLDKFLTPWGYKVEGTVRWRGEEMEDIGVIVVKRNVVFSRTVKLDI